MPEVKEPKEVTFESFIHAKPVELGTVTQFADKGALVVVRGDSGEQYTISRHRVERDVFLRDRVAVSRWPLPKPGTLTAWKSLDFSQFLARAQAIRNREQDAAMKQLSEPQVVISSPSPADEQKEIDEMRLNGDPGVDPTGAWAESVAEPAEEEESEEQRPTVTFSMSPPAVYPPIESDPLARMQETLNRVTRFDSPQEVEPVEDEPVTEKDAPKAYKWTPKWKKELAQNTEPDAYGNPEEGPPAGYRIPGARFVETGLVEEVLPSGVRRIEGSSTQRKYWVRETNLRGTGNELQEGYIMVFAGRGNASYAFIGYDYLPARLRPDLDTLQEPIQEQASEPVTPAAQISTGTKHPPLVDYRDRKENTRPAPEAPAFLQHEEPIAPEEIYEPAPVTTAAAPAPEIIPDETAIPKTSVSLAAEATLDIVDEIGGDDIELESAAPVETLDLPTEDLIDLSDEPLPQLMVQEIKTPGTIVRATELPALGSQPLLRVLQLQNEVQELQARAQAKQTEAFQTLLNELGTERRFIESLDEEMRTWDR